MYKGGHKMTQEEIKQSFTTLLQKPEFADKNTELASVIIDWMIVGAMYIQPIIIKKACNAFCMITCGHVRENCDCMNRMNIQKAMEEAK